MGQRRRNNEIVRLTDDQRQLVEDNLALAGWFIRRDVESIRLLVRQYPSMEDAFQVAVIGLCYAAARHNPRLGEFSTYAAFWMFQVLSREARYQTGLRLPWTVTDRQTEFVEQLEQGHKIPAREADPDAEIDRRDRLATLSYWIGKMPPKHRDVLMLHLEGKPARDISRIVGICKSRVNQIIPKAKAWLCRYVPRPQVAAA